MKNYYLLLFLLLPFISEANSSIHSEKDFLQLEGLYQLIPEENQAAEDFNYIYFAQNYTAYFKKGMVSYVALNNVEGSNTVDGVRLDVNYLNHSSTMNLSSEETFQPAVIRKPINGVNYQLKKVNSLTMQEIYPNIDLEFFVNDEGGLQYLYNLKPGADVTDIQLQYDGSQNLEINTEGELVVNTSVGKMTESSPITFRGENEKKVKSNYVVNKNNTIGFSIKKYNSTESYIIDPYIKWSTFFGGTGGERANDLTVDQNDFVYVTGYTESTDFPATPGAFQTTLDNQQDIAIIKLDSTGNTIFATYFGGDKRDEGNDIDVASNGNIYVTGITESSDFPVTDNSIFKGGIDAVLIALQPNGSRIWSRYLSGSSDDRGESIIVNGNNLYVGGSTSSNDFPMAVPGSLVGDLDAFLMQLDINGNAVWAEFYGGTTAEEAFGLAQDNIGNLIIAGRTSSNDLPVSTNAFQTNNAGLDDAFIAKYSPSGNLLWSTYYGGSDFDQIKDIGVDDLGNIYFSGLTSSSDLQFPTSTGNNTNYDTNYGGGTFDGLVGKVNPIGQFEWATYYGGTDHDEFEGIGVSSIRSAIISGKTYSADFEVTSNAHQPTLAGGADAVIVQFDSTGNPFYSSFLGGAQDEDVVASTFGKDDRMFYTAGNTKSPEFPTTQGTAQPNYAGNNDMFIVAFCALAPNNNIITNTGADTIYVCPGTPLPLLDGTTPTGGSGQYRFQYQSASPGGVFVDISGATNEDYQVVGINSTTQFRRIVYDGQCADTSQAITIFFTQQPIAAFDTDDVCDAVNDSIHFTDQSQANGATITSYIYYFGDGDSSTMANPVHLYDSAGAYTATLIITTNQGCTDTVSQVVDVSYTPVAGFTTSNLCANQPMLFTNLTTIQGGVVNYLWMFGDDSTSTEINPVHYYLNPGTYNVTLIATSGSCADTAQQTVVVEESPFADFSFDITCPDSSVTFTNLSTIPTGSIVSYNWNFGDGTTSTQTNPTKTFNRGGPYNVMLVATANTGCTDTIIKQVNPDSVITADFSFINNCLNQPTQFNSLSTSTNGFIVSYDWDFGDGSGTSTQANPTYTYTANGDYTVTLIVTSNIGCVDTITKVVGINPPPTAIFTATNECPNVDVTFTNLSLSTATNVDYIWDFGDGTGSSDFAPTKSYDTSGTYTVHLTVINDGGCTHDTSQTITIYPDPVADFDFASATCLDSVTVFNNTSTIATGNIVQYNWNFGDNSTSSDTDPTHVYSQVGTYTVTLVATSDNGCVDTTTQEVTINPLPTASFAVGDGCSGVDLAFQNLSTSTIANPVYTWDFGDGTSSNDVDPMKAYANPGTYTVMLTIDENGCTDDTSMTITVYPDPIADFDFTSLNCVETVSFTNQSTISAGSIDTYFWNFGDETISSDENPNHQYNASGTYDVTLIITSNNGCTDTITKNIQISVKPNADFSYSATCEGQAVNFTNTTNTGDSIVSFHYDFGVNNTNNDTSTLENPSFTYFNTGSYDVWFIIETVQGCRDTVVKTINVVEPPFVDAGPDRTFTQGNARGVQLDANGSTSGGTYEWSPATGLNSTTTKSPLATPTETTDYTVTFTNAEGCTATDVVRVTILSAFTIPTAYSPNNDGFNDFFEINGIECYPNHNIKIYDQWGALLYENTGSYHENPWDGRHDGEEMPFAAYYYILDLNTNDLSGVCGNLQSPANKKFYKGTVTILR